MAAGGDDSDTKPGLSDHVADSVEAVVALHEEHYGAAGALQRTFERCVDVLGRPAAALVVIAGLGVWAALAAIASGGHGDGPVFAWLEFAATLSALVIALMILVTQRRQDELAER